MLRGNFIKPTKKLLTINKINLPLDVLNIVKDYMFYTLNSMTHVRKLITEKKELDLIKKAWSRNNILNIFNQHSSRLYEEHWIFGFTYENGPNETVQLQGVNCKKCGEYEYNRYSYKTHLKSNLRFCPGGDCSKSINTYELLYSD